MDQLFVSGTVPSNPLFMGLCLHYQQFNQLSDLVQLGAEFLKVPKLLGLLLRILAFASFRF